MNKTATKPVPVLELISGVILAGALLWLYWPVLVQLADQLTTSEDYSFGLLLPLVSAYIVYLKWPQLRTLPWRPSWMGLAVIALGLVLYIFGNLVAIFYIPPVSMLIVITGIILLMGGRSLVRQLAFPLLLLFLMIPLPALVMKELTLPLQLLSSRLAAGFLHVVGIPLVLHGNVIDLGVRQLQVVDACSGLRYILSLTALGIIYCYFYQRRVWKAAILIISLVPAAILANALRVAAMGLYPALQEGFWHGFSGWLIFLFCFGFLALLNWLLEIIRPRPPVSAASQPATGREQPPLSTRGSLLPYMGAALILVLLSIPVISRLASALPVPLLQSFDHFPLQLGPWQGQRNYLDPAMAKAVGADAYFDATYVNPEHGTVSLWIAYFETQETKTVGRIHSPLICLTGGGWKILDSRIGEVAPGRPVRDLLMEQGGTRQVVYYWYLQSGRWLASEYPVKLYMGLDGLLKRRNDGALIRLVTPAGTSVERARQRLNIFTQSLIPLLPKFFHE